MIFRRYQQERAYALLVRCSICRMFQYSIEWPYFCFYLPNVWLDFIVLNVANGYLLWANKCTKEEKKKYKNETGGRAKSGVTGSMEMKKEGIVCKDVCKRRKCRNQQPRVIDRFEFI